MGGFPFDHLTKLRLKPTSKRKASERAQRLLSDAVGWYRSLDYHIEEAPMPNVAEIIKDHVTLEVNCVDRLYLNGYVPRLQQDGGVIGFLCRARGQKIPSPAVLGQITQLILPHRFRLDTAHV
jgi:hypothetical protein